MAGDLKCSICNHPSVLDINKALVGTRSLASISREFNVSSDSLRTHREKHIPVALVKSLKNKELASSMNIIGELEDLIERTKRILEDAERKRKYGIALHAIGETRNTFELLAKIIVAIKDAQSLEHEESREIMEQNIIEEMQAQAGERAQILSNAERSILRLITAKMISGDKYIRILPDDLLEDERQSILNKFYPIAQKPDSNKGISRRTRLLSKSQDYSERQNLDIGTGKEREFDNDNKVKPIEPKKIPLTRWDENPLNPKYHFRKDK